MVFPSKKKVDGFNLNYKYIKNFNLFFLIFSDEGNINKHIYQEHHLIFFLEKGKM